MTMKIRKRTEDKKQRKKLEQVKTYANIACAKRTKERMEDVLEATIHVNDVNEPTQTKRRVEEAMKNDWKEIGTIYSNKINTKDQMNKVTTQLR